MVGDKASSTYETGTDSEEPTISPVVISLITLTLIPIRTGILRGTYRHICAGCAQGYCAELIGVLRGTRTGILRGPPAVYRDIVRAAYSHIARDPYRYCVREIIIVIWK
jgi:hypothetical protein